MRERCVAASDPSRNPLAARRNVHWPISSVSGGRVRLMIVVSIMGDEDDVGMPATG